MIDHLSISQLDMFTRCGEQYRRRYVEGEVIPPGIAAHIGTGVHRAAEINWREKMRTGHDMPMDAIQDCAAEAYDKALQNGVFFAPDELSGATLAMSEGKDTAVSLATLFRHELAPAITPAMVEEKMVMDLPGVDLPVVVILDLYTEDKTLRDLKTSSRKWNADKAHASNQPTAYREAIRQATGEYPAQLIFDVLIGSRTPALQSIATTRGEDDLTILARKFQLMCRAISAGIFQPAPPDHWCCSPRFCGYFFTCPHIPAHRKTLPRKSA